MEGADGAPTATEGDVLGHDPLAVGKVGGWKGWGQHLGVGQSDAPRRLAQVLASAASR
jgi:hypothetical protein